MIPTLQEYMHRQGIRDKVKQATSELFGFEIVDEGLIKKIEDNMYESFELVAKSMAKESGDHDMMLSGILTLLDLNLTNIIMLTLQNKFIEEMMDKENEPE